MTCSLSPAEEETVFHWEKAALERHRLGCLVCGYVGPFMLACASGHRFCTLCHRPGRACRNYLYVEGRTPPYRLVGREAEPHDPSFSSDGLVRWTRDPCAHCVYFLPEPCIPSEEADDCPKCGQENARVADYEYWHDARCPSRVFSETQIAAMHTLHIRRSAPHGLRRGEAIVWGRTGVVGPISAPVCLGTAPTGLRPCQLLGVPSSAHITHYPRDGLEGDGAPPTLGRRKYPFVYRLTPPQLARFAAILPGDRRHFLEKHGASITIFFDRLPVHAQHRDAALGRRRVNQYRCPSGCIHRDVRDLARACWPPIFDKDEIAHIWKTAAALNGTPLPVALRRQHISKYTAITIVVTDHNFSRDWASTLASYLRLGLSTLCQGTTILFSYDITPSRLKTYKRPGYSKAEEGKSELENTEDPYVPQRVSSFHRVFQLVCTAIPESVWPQILAKWSKGPLVADVIAQIDRNAYRLMRACLLGRIREANHFFYEHQRAVRALDFPVRMPLRPDLFIKELEGASLDPDARAHSRQVRQLSALLDRLWNGGSASEWPTSFFEGPSHYAVPTTDAERMEPRHPSDERRLRTKFTRAFQYTIDPSVSLY